MKVESKGKSVIYQGREISLGYGQINHLIPHDLWQCGLSLPALGLAGYLYTLPKQWRLSVTHLSKQLAMSKNTCRKYLKEIFSNEKAREVFKVKEAEINTYDFEEGFTAYDYASDKEELENFTSSVAKDVSEPNRKRVLLIQTQRQRYLLNLCFSIKDSAFGLESRISSPRLCDRHPSLISAHGSKSHDSSSKILESQDDKSVRENSQAVGFCDDFGGFQAVGAGIYLGDNEQAHRAESTKSAQKPTPDKNAQILSTIKRDSKESLKDSSSKRTREKSNNDLTSFLDLQSFSQNEQEAIKLWIRYKQESTRKPFKPSQIDFQLRKITRLKEQGQDICAVIEKSLDMGWQGLFPQRDSALRDKAGSLPFACAIDTQVLSPHKSRRNPALSSQNQRSGASVSSQVSLEILESQEIKLKTKMPKNIGGKSVLRVENV